MKRLFAIFIVLCLALSVCIAVSADDQAQYTYSTDANSGIRHEVCTTLLGTSASAYYTGSYRYENLSGLDSDDLLSALRTLMTNTHTTNSSYANCRDMAVLTDCENADGTSISLLYTSYSSSWADWINNNSQGWNREHVWPQSLGNFGTSGPGADLHHVRPSDQTVNGTRGNLKYGNVTGGTAVRGTSITQNALGGYKSSTYFEPLDNVKGDVARICLYMYVRYGGMSNYNCNSITNVFESVDVLLDWCALDPVDTWEMGRNEVVAAYQGNRNVFIDYPELAWLLFDEEIPCTLTTPSGKVFHSYEAVVTAPTCSSQGYTTYTCSGCGDSYVADYVSSLSHTFGYIEEMQTMDPTCDTPGELTLVVHCGLCGEGYSANCRNIDPVGHSFADGICTVCGDPIVLSGSCGNALTWTYDPDNTTLTIDGSGTMYDYLFAGFWFGWGEYAPWFTFNDEISTLVLGADITSIGRDAFYSCDQITELYILSEEIVSRTTSINAFNDLLCSIDNIYLLPTMTELPDYLRNNCQEMSGVDLNGTTFVQYHHHRFTELLQSEDCTCTEDGYTIHECRCGAQSTTILPAAHSLELVERVTPTCTEDGYILRQCSVCGMQEKDILPAEHNFSTLERVDPTCTEDGYILRQCTNCSDTETIVLKKTGHTYIDRTCTLCGDVLPENILFGECGDNLIWTLDTDTGALCIAGTGPMYDYSEPNDGFPAPWHSYASEIRTVDIGDNVTYIGCFSFSGLTEIQTIEIPVGTMAIGFNILSGCDNLTQLSLYCEYLEYCDEFAFSDCNNLQNLYLRSANTAERMNEFGKLCESVQYIYIDTTLIENSTHPTRSQFSCTNAAETVTIDGVSYQKFTRGIHSLEVTEIIPADCTNTGLITETCSTCQCCFYSTTPATGHSINEAYVCDYCNEAFEYIFDYDLTLDQLVLRNDGRYYTQDGHAVVIAIHAPLEYLGGMALSEYVNEFGDQYFGMTYWDQLVNATNEDGYVFLTEESLIWILDVITGNPAWGEDESALCYYIGFYVDHNAVCSHTEYDSVTTPPTCTENGYTTYNCTLCGEIWTNNYVDAFGHDVKDGCCCNCGAVFITITSDLEDTYVSSGKKATVTVEAEGEGLSYAWYYRDGSSGAFKLTTSFTGNSYSVTMNASRSGRQVYCVITDANGYSVQTATVTLGMKATIITQPKSASVKSKETITVSLEAAGDGLTYTWYYSDDGGLNFRKTTSFTGNSYSITMTSARAGRKVYCVVTDKFGNIVTSKTVTLGMRGTAAIRTQPASVTVANGETAKVAVRASGTGLTYEWYFSDNGGLSFSKTTAFTGNSYSIKMTSARAGRQVYCVVTDKNGNSVQTDTVTLGMTGKATIHTQPVSVTVASGETAKVAVRASGTGLTYEWYFSDNGGLSFTKTTAFTGNSYSIKMTTSRAGRQVYCVVTDKNGNCVKSEVVTLGMTGKAAIRTQPVSVTVANGATAKVAVRASGTGLTYTWFYSDDGGKTFKVTTAFTGSTYSVTMNAKRAGRMVYCVITDANGNKVTTDVVTLNMG